MVVKFLDVAQSLHDKLLSVAPIEGVSISDESDKSEVLPIHPFMFGLKNFVLPMILSILMIQDL
jgi:hypothetical protein